MTDLDLLDALLDDDRLTDKERNAFSEMHERLRIHAFGYDSLSPRQRDWADNVFHRLELVTITENLVPSGRVSPSPAERAKRYPYESLPRPLKPPGRS